MTVLLAFDYGERRIGVAIGNTITRSARPLTTIHHATVDERFRKIEALVCEWQATQLIVGLPSHPDGTAHEMTARCKRFADQLRGRLALPVTLVDERYTSAIAEQDRADDIDSHAACLILESYFNTHAS